MVVSFEATLAGDVSQFGAAEQEAYREGLAAWLAGINKDDIVLLIASASIRVTAEITSADASVANSVEAALSSVTPTQLSRIVRRQGGDVTVLAVAVPYTRTELRDRTPATASDMGSVVIACVIVVIVLSCLVVAYYVRRTRRASTPHTAPATHTSPISTTSATPAMVELPFAKQPMTFVEKVRFIEVRLNLSGNVADVVNKAAMELGVDATGKALMETATLCVQACTDLEHVELEHADGDRPVGSHTC